MAGTNQDGRPTVDVCWERPGVVCVSLGGEHDVANAAELGYQLDGALAPFDHLIVDLTEVAFIDSLIMRVLVIAKRSAEDQGRQFSLVLGADAPIEKALTIADVLAYLNRYSTLEEALAG
jgi:anti-anti-sigma factor